MAVGKSKSTSSEGSSGKKPEPVETLISVDQFQRLDERQLDALLSQHKIDAAKDLPVSEKVGLVLDHHVALGNKLTGTGTLQVLPDGFGFLRSRWFNYLGGPDDIYVSPSQIRKFSLKNGDKVTGQVRPPKENERFFALLRVFKVNDLDPEQALEAPVFDDLSPLAPRDQIELGANDGGSASCRIIDLIAPIGLGQRGIISGPARSGKTKLMEQLCRSMLASDTGLYAFVLLVDQRPEEIAELEQGLNSGRCEVISSVFDESSYRHHDVTMMVQERAKRLVELGENIVIFLDSLTNLARFELGPGFSTERLDPDSLPRTRSFLASARRTEDAGSLTIIGTLSTGSDSELDDAISTALRSTANLDVHLDHELVKRRIWPAINVHLSQSQQEETLLGENYPPVCKLRRCLGEKGPAEAMDFLLSQIENSDSNAEWLNAL